MKFLKKIYLWIGERASSFFNNFESGLTKVLVALSPIYFIWMVYQAFA